MQILMGFAVGAVTALFFTAFGMAIQRRIDGEDENDER